MNPFMLRAIVCGSGMFALAGASIWLTSQIDVPLAGEYDYMFLDQPARLLWYDQQRYDPNRAGISVYDLQTDQIQSRSVAQVPIENHTLADGNTTRLALSGNAQTLRILERDTSKTLRQLRVPQCLDGDLLDKRYMVGHDSGNLIVCDLLAPDPAQTRSAQIATWQRGTDTAVYLVGDTNLVVVVTDNTLVPSQTTLVNPPPPPPPTVTNHVYRIDEHAIQLVASWQSAKCDGQILRERDTLLSLSTDSSKLERRDLDSLNVVRSTELTKEFVSRLPWTRFRQDLCEVSDFSRSKVTVYRLDTLEELRGTEGLTIEPWTWQLENLSSRYRQLRGAYVATPPQPNRLAVYDLDQSKIVFDRTYDSFPAASLLVNADRLAVATLRSGLTAEVFDLKSGKCIKTVRPFAWLLPWYVVWSVAAACVPFGWIYYSARAGLSLPTSILLLAAAFVPIQIYPLTQHGTVVNVGRLATSYSLAILMSASAGVVWIGFSRIQNRTMRWTYQLAVLSILALALVNLELHDSFRAAWVLPMAIIISVASMYASFIILMIMRLLGYRVQWVGKDLPARSNPSLSQFFALNAACAGLVVSCMPMRFIHWQMPQTLLQAGGPVAPVVALFLFVFLFLKMSDRWFRRCLVVAILAAGVLVIDFVASFVRPFLSLRMDIATIRISLATLVITFLWLWAFRLRGCRLSRPAAL